jgi:tetratricopeptide (TPR) repeat protein
MSRVGDPRAGATTPAAATRRDREIAWLLAIVAIAMGVRFVHFLTIVGTAFPRFPLVFDQSDMNTFWEWAQAIRGGDWLGRATYHPMFDWMVAIAPANTWYQWWGGRPIFQQAPLYPYWVATLLTVSRGSLEFVIVIQLVLGAFQPVVMFWLGRRLFDTRTGLVAAVLTAIYMPFVFHESVLLRDWLPPILEPLAIVALLRARACDRPRAWCLAGTALGLALLAKETLLLFVPFALLWLVLGYRRAPRHAVTATLAVLVGLLVVLAPLVIRNVVVGAPPLAFSNRAVEGLIEGNAADGFPIGLTHPPSMQRILERSDGRPMAVLRETLATYQGDWSHLLRLELLKLRALADPLEVPNNADLYYAREISPILRLGLSYGMILPLAVAGFLLSLPSWHRHMLLMLYLLAALTGLMATIILARFRLVLVPVLIVYAAVGLVRVWDAARARKVAEGTAYLSLVAGVAVVQHLVLPVPALRDMPPIAVHRPEYLVAAYIYAHDGRFDRALAEIERLEARAAERPGFGDLRREASLYEGDLRMLWAGQLLGQGRHELAIREAERADIAYSSHPEVFYPLYTLGFLYLKLGELGKAKAYLTRFVSGEPFGEKSERARRALAGMSDR